MPVEGGLVGEYVDVVVMDMHAIGHVLDHDGTVLVTDEVMEKRDRKLVVHGLGDDGYVGQCFLHLVYRGEVAGYPQGELVCREVGLTLDGICLELGVAGKVEPGDGEALLVCAIEVERNASDHDARPDDRVILPRLDPEGVSALVAAGSHGDLLAIAAVPIEVAGEVHVALIIGEPNSRAHGELLPAQNRVHTYFHEPVYSKNNRSLLIFYRSPVIFSSFHCKIWTFQH